MHRRNLLRTAIIATTFTATSLLTGPAGAQDTRDPAPALYLAPETSTAGAAIATGPDGTLHMVGASYNASQDDAVVYGACLADCMEAGNWSRVDLPVPDVVRAEIAVTPQGAPRLLIIAGAPDSSGGRDFLYAECNAVAAPISPSPPGVRRGWWVGQPVAAPAQSPAASGASCFDPAGWTITRIAGNNESSMGDFFELVLPKRTFVLGPGGEPRFIYSDSNYFIEPDHYGAFYMSCEAACTNVGNWTETDLANHYGYSTELMTRPVLAMGPDGSAHMLAWVYAFDPDTGAELPDDVYYYYCPADCTAHANWQRTSLINAGSGSYPSPTYDLQTDANGHPRAAVFVAGGPTQADLENSLIYLWCDAACTTDDSWTGTVVFTNSYGEAPALALNAGGHPRIAFLSPEARPVVARCDTACESVDGASWDGFVFEADADMAADRPTALPFTCDAELWNALSPDLAIGADGSSFVAYDVSVQARCLYRELLEPEITFDFHEIWRGARLAEIAP